MTLATRSFDGRLSSVILKVTGACNFSCPRCYMFRSGDASFRSRPTHMPRRTMDATVTCLARYVRSARIPELEVILHGGEPLLLGVPAMTYLLTQLEGLQAFTDLRLSLQTNGSLLSRPFLDLFRAHRVSVGVSFDGERATQDRNRPADGRSTYDAVVRGIRLLQHELGTEQFRGLLAVIDLAADPVATYEHIRSLGVDRMDFLLPLRNHARPLEYDPAPRAYARWLERMFDHYIAADDPTVNVRIFTSIIDLLLGAELPMCAIRHSAADIVTIETNGSVELVDDLRICGEDFTNAGVNVATHELTDLFSTPKFEAVLDAERTFPAPCRTCPHFDICGSGGHAFRYGPDGTYDHPSIYCEETIELIEHIRAAIVRLSEPARTPRRHRASVAST